MRDIILILLILLMILIMGFVEGQDIELELKHSKVTYCEYYSCYEDSSPVIYDFDKK